MNKLTVGLFGFGIVGEGIYKSLTNHPNSGIYIKRICVKHINKLRNAPNELFTTNSADLLNDDEINVIVELIDDSSAAFAINIAAMKNKKNVVTANKKLIAENLQELLSAAQDNNVTFLYEASVCSCIPIIRNLEDYYNNDYLNSFVGIVNASTNFILSKMEQDKISYTAALEIAQEFGLTESDPTLDVEGKDALYKLLIVMYHGFGLHANSTHILHSGIVNIQEYDINFAKQHYSKIKLVASIIRNNKDNLIAYVLPTFIPSTSILYNVNNEFNGVTINTNTNDELFLHGKGAGRNPTSSAVLSDISALLIGYRYKYTKSESKSNYKITNDNTMKIYISYPTNYSIDKSMFIQISEEHICQERQHIIGTTSLRNIKDSNLLSKKGVSIIEVKF